MADTEPAVTKLLPVILPEAITCPLVLILPPVTVPLTLTPVVLNTATLLVPPIDTVALPLGDTIRTLLVPELMLLPAVVTLVSPAPLPTKYWA